MATLLCMGGTVLVRWKVVEEELILFLKILGFIYADL